MRFIIIIIVFLITLQATYAQQPALDMPNTDKPQPSIDEIKRRAFDNVSASLDMGAFLPEDPDLNKYRQILAEKRNHAQGKQLCSFSNGEYAVINLDPTYLDKVLYYDTNGKLLKVSYRMLPYFTQSPQEFYNMMNDVKNYPMVQYFYAYPEGELLAVDIEMSPGKNFLFNKEGLFTGYWQEGKGFDTENKEIMNRTSLHFANTLDSNIPSTPADNSDVLANSGENVFQNIKDVGIVKDDLKMAQEKLKIAQTDLVTLQEQLRMLINELNIYLRNQN